MTLPLLCRWPPWSTGPREFCDHFVSNGPVRDAGKALDQPFCATTGSLDEKGGRGWAKEGEGGQGHGDRVGVAVEDGVGAEWW